MELLNENKLKWSTVVANSTMNRSRNLAGVNSYANDLYFDVLPYLLNRLEKEETVVWIDICCGEGKALIQASKKIEEKKLGNRIKLEGIDLVDMFDRSIEGVDIELTIASLQDWKPTKRYDLITCVHGLHYIGDKLNLISKIASTLKEDGLFIGNFDLENIKDEENTSLKKSILQEFKSQGLEYNSRRKTLTCRANKELNFKVEYLGANDKAGPNYTGQPVVDSIYRLVK